MDRVRTQAKVLDKVDEVVYTLRISQLPTILVEGSSDVRIYIRWASHRLLGTYHVDVLPVNGRSNLFRIYERRDEFAHLPVAFVADQDMWLFTEVPKEYENIIWTEGYSLVNDLYADAGSQLERLMDSHETEQYQRMLDSLCKWFAFEVEEYLAGKPIHVNSRLQKIIPPEQTELSTDFCRYRGFRLPNSKLFQEIRDNYQLKLNGKFLFDILGRSLKARGRTNISSDALYHIALTIPELHPRIDRLMQEVEKELNGREATPDKSYGHLKEILKKEIQK